MKSKFYQPGAERADRVHDLFRTIARRYDRLNDLMSLGLHRRWKKRLVRMAGQPGRVLDLCCGTGDIARRFHGQVVGLDFTKEMLQVAQTRSAAVSWVRGDALRLPFADNAFDVVTVGYGLRNLADLASGLCEIQRVLKPGGRFLSLDFGKPRSGAWRSVYFAYLRLSVPVMGKLFCGDREAYAYILPSLENYAAQRGTAQLMQELGFHNTGFIDLWGGAMAINYGSKPTVH